ncbi:MAG: hypothetical protein INH41_16475, partial [Myxococcaceae bacterium]|nr:hypothetical protein [Myxococcaceae bacterium]
MVSEADFEAALELLPAEKRETPLEAIYELENVSAIVNDPWTPGVYGKLTPEVQPEAVEGRFWVVAGPGAGVDRTGSFMIAKNFRLAVIDLNIPKPIWVGFLARGARRPTPGTETGRCCGPENLCIGSGVPAVGPCGDPSAKCVSSTGRVSHYGRPQDFGAFLGSQDKPIIQTLTFSKGLPLPPVACLPRRLTGCSASKGMCDFGVFVDTNRSYDA